MIARLKNKNALRASTAPACPSLASRRVHDLSGGALLGVLRAAFMNERLDAQAFNQDIDSWNVAAVTTLKQGMCCDSRKILATRPLCPRAALRAVSLLVHACTC